MAFEPRTNRLSPDAAKKKNQLKFVTTPEEWQIISEEAHKRQVSKTQFIRDAIAAYIQTDK